MKRRDTIELLNAEGPIMTLCKFGPVGKKAPKFVIEIKASGAKWTLTEKDVNRFLDGTLTLIENAMTPTVKKEWKYSDFSEDMKPSASRLEEFFAAVEPLKSN